MRLRALSAGCLFLATTCIGAAAFAQSQPEGPAFEDRELEALASPELETFASEQEFSQYLRDTARIYRRRHPRRDRRWSIERGSPEIVVAQVEIDCDAMPEHEACLEEEADGPAVVVTGSRVSTPTITNVQVAGVDEGDIVKQIGSYVLVLQDGRIFATHYPTMRLTDRIDVYRRDRDGDPIGADWYDEMLVQDDQIIIAAYDYNEEASEISVFRLDQATGRIERRGVFLITSDDYYDIDNYTTRVIGDNLVMHTPYEADNLASRRSRPVVRRWQQNESRDEALREARRLFDARSIYRPVFALESPVVHTISVCPLGDVAITGLQCRTTGFVGTEMAEMFVTPDYIYLWLAAFDWEDNRQYECPELPGRPDASLIVPAAVMRLPVGRGDPLVMSARGVPFNQFSMDEHNGRFRALVSWRRHYCEIDDNDEEQEVQEVALLDEPRSAFGPIYREARDNRFVELPSPGMRVVENRFAGDWLIYGGRQSYSGRPYLYDDEQEPVIPRASAIAVPLRNPSASIRIDQPHNVIRIERLGDDIVVNGYRDTSGLNVSYVDLGATARIASTFRLDNRFESEGRSHAFNSTVDQGGGGILGIPTVEPIEEAGRSWWWSGESDLNLLTFDTDGRLADAGHLEGRTEEEVETAPGYECEVSCIDWYGNARPIFLGGKVLGLMATELVEAELVAGKVIERRRVDLTGPIGAR